MHILPLHPISSWIGCNVEHSTNLDTPLDKIEEENDGILG
jgi:hypothetical protein